jgi:hypothetical protein
LQAQLGEAVKFDIKPLRDLKAGAVTHLGVLLVVEQTIGTPTYRFTSCRVRLTADNAYEQVVVFGHLLPHQVDQVIGIQQGKSEIEVRHVEPGTEEDVVEAKVRFEVTVKNVPAGGGPAIVREAYVQMLHRPVWANVATEVEGVRSEEQGDVADGKAVIRLSYLELEQILRGA